MWPCCCPRETICATFFRYPWMIEWTRAFRSERPLWTSSEKTTLNIPSFSRIRRTWAVTSRCRTWSASVAPFDACTTYHFEYSIQECVFAFEVAIDRRRNQPDSPGDPRYAETLQALGGDRPKTPLGQFFLPVFGIKFSWPHFSIM